MILWLFLLAAGGLLVNDAVSIFFRPDNSVVVMKEDGKFQVWNTPQAYEQDTGKNWVQQPLNNSELVATHHDAAKAQALGGLAYHLLVFVLSIIGLRAIQPPPS